MTWPIELVLAGTTGLTIGVFDRSCRYTLLLGGSTEPRSVGRRVGELNANREEGERAFQAARRAIRFRETTTFVVSHGGKTFDVRVTPVIHDLFGCVGGVIYGWDVTDRTARSLDPT